LTAGHQASHVPAIDGTPTAGFDRVADQKIPTNIAAMATLTLQLLKFYTAAQDDAYFEGMGC